MKKNYSIILFLFTILTFVSCDKQKNNIEVENIEVENIESEELIPEITEENEIVQFYYDGVKKDDIPGIISGKDGRPDEVDIASGHTIILEDWYSKEISQDGKYYIYDNIEYRYTYNRYCIPVEGHREDLNLIMLKEESPLFNPNNMGSNITEECSLGCEFVPLARSKEPVLFKDQKSYWFKVSENEWIPGTSVYIQIGAFEKLPVEDLEVGLSYEMIKGGAWFSVKTDDGSDLKLRDSSNMKTGKVISDIPQGTWIYAAAQTSETETIDGIDSRWYKIVYPETGYVFGGYLEKHEDVCGLNFAAFDMPSYRHDDSDNYMYKVYSAPSTESEYLGEYEIKPGEYDCYYALIETNKLETLDGIQGLWINITEPVKGFIFGYNFIYK